MHTLPVVARRFLFSQAPALLLPMWKQGSCSQGGSRLGSLTPPPPGPDSAGNSLGPATPSPVLTQPAEVGGLSARGPG